MCYGIIVNWICGISVDFWILFNFALWQVCKQILKQDNEATTKSVHLWNTLVSISSRGKALYPSGYNAKACLTVEVSLTVVVYPAVVVYQQVVVVIVVLEIIIHVLGTTIMNATTWVIPRRKRLLYRKRCAKTINYMKGEIDHFENFDHVDFNDMYPCRFCLNLRRSLLFVNKCFT